MKPSPQVAVVVVSYNTRDLLISCLSSVIESTRPADVEIVVVDNASNDGSLEAVRQTYPQVMTIANPANLGFAVACNQAIRGSTAPFVLLLNSDATITPQSFQTLYETMSANAQCGAAGCRIVNSEGSETTNTRNFLTPFNQALEQAGVMGWINWKYLRRSYRPTLDQNELDCAVDWIDGACLMIRRAALDEVGLFEEEFFIYSEDEDLCFRLRKQGWTICYSAKATARHHGAASTSQNRFEMLRHFYSSQMLFLSKHRGHAAAFLYAMAMKTVLFLKASLLRDRTRRETAREQLRALRTVNGK
jgi:N-acetylglucosaminyl-diphospho-decaprenol L-rhamnosyltransferase